MLINENELWDGLLYKIYFLLNDLFLRNNVKTRKTEFSPYTATPTAMHIVAFPMEIGQ
jgi:hypothetical protein